MSTTEILFNSPALHSLKRAQLVQLCKRHNIKAAGKNTELVERLKQHALTLKLDQINDANDKEKKAVENDDDDSITDELDSDVFDRPQRPSEMWEIVMDDIPEEEGRSSNPGSLKVKGIGQEFGGTGGSSKCKCRLPSLPQSLTPSMADPQPPYRLLSRLSRLLWVSNEVWLYRSQAP